MRNAKSQTKGLFSKQELLWNWFCKMQIASFGTNRTLANFLFIYRCIIMEHLSFVLYGQENV